MQFTEIYGFKNNTWIWIKYMKYVQQLYKVLDKYCSSYYDLLSTRLFIIFMILLVFLSKILKVRLYTQEIGMDTLYT